MADWIKIDRKMLEWEWYKDANTARLWLHILLKANWKAGRFQGIEVPPGSCVSSMSHLAAELGISKPTVIRCINKLKSTGEITTRAYRRFTLISVCSWALYQTETNRERTDGVTDAVPMALPNRRRKESKKERKKENIYALSSDESSEEVVWEYEPGD